jgi:hypothetical protein
MKRNMGITDRIIRISLSAAIGVMILERVLHGTVGVVFGILAVILFLTSLSGFCPIYQILDIASIHEKEHKE